MGYCMTENDCVFFIDKTNIPELIKAIKALAEDPSKMTGGRYHLGKKTERHYSFVNNSFVDTDDIEKIFDIWRWAISLDDDGNIVDIGFRGEKSGDDNMLFQAIAPYVKEGSYIEMRGEDGAMWRWVFKNKTCGEIYPKIEW